MHRHRQHSTDTPQRNGQSWWGRTWRLAAGLALGLALGTPPAAYAKIFYCGAGDVQCLIDGIHEANADGVVFQMWI